MFVSVGINLANCDELIWNTLKTKPERLFSHLMEIFLIFHSQEPESMLEILLDSRMINWIWNKYLQIDLRLWEK